MEHNFQIVAILTIGFALASVLGFLAQKTKLPTIFGYLLAGYLAGPFSPGYAIDLTISEQMAEVGIILMLFAVGLHFKLQDLDKVKKIAIPGAVGQIFIASLSGFLLVYSGGWSMESGIIMGIAISVASTVVLVHVLGEKSLLETRSGHIAIGWLIVEDIFTVAVLILLPLLSKYTTEGTLSAGAVTIAVLSVLFRFVALATVMFFWGQKAVTYILTNVARLKSAELLTLTVLAIAFVIATTSTVVFGMSAALGAFVAGMVIGRTHIRHQAAASILPLKDAFAVIFFLSVGMLFNPIAIAENPLLFAGILTTILLVKPIAAFLIVTLLKYPLRTALTVSVGLAQIGEFSFILAEEALQYKLLPDAGYDILVACALISISINPLLFNIVEWLEHHIRKSSLNSLFHHHPHIHVNDETSHQEGLAPKVILVGCGPVGQATLQALEKIKDQIVVIEQNIDTVLSLKEKDIKVIFGDASNVNILQVAQIHEADLIIITVPEKSILVSIIRTVKQLNPKIKIISRTSYISEQNSLEKMGIESVCSEKEILEGFTRRVSAAITNIGASV